MALEGSKTTLERLEALVGGQAELRAVVPAGHSAPDSTLYDTVAQLQRISLDVGLGFSVDELRPDDEDEEEGDGEGPPQEAKAAPSEQAAAAADSSPAVVLPALSKTVKVEMYSVTETLCVIATVLLHSYTGALLSVSAVDAEDQELHADVTAELATLIERRQWALLGAKFGALTAYLQQFDGDGAPAAADGARRTEAVAELFGKLAAPGDRCVRMLEGPAVRLHSFHAFNSSRPHPLACPHPGAPQPLRHVHLVCAGTTADGALRLTLRPPLPVDDAALQQLRDWGAAVQSVVSADPVAALLGDAGWHRGGAGFKPHGCGAQAIATATAATADPSVLVTASAVHSTTKLSDAAVFHFEFAAAAAAAGESEAAGHRCCLLFAPSASEPSAPTGSLKRKRSAAKSSAGSSGGGVHVLSSFTLPAAKQAASLSKAVALLRARCVVSELSFSCFAANDHVPVPSAQVLRFIPDGALRAPMWAPARSLRCEVLDDGGVGGDCLRVRAVADSGSFLVTVKATTADKGGEGDFEVELAPDGGGGGSAKQLQEARRFAAEVLRLSRHVPAMMHALVDRLPAAVLRKAGKKSKKKQRA